MTVVAFDTEPAAPRWHEASVEERRRFAAVSWDRGLRAAVSASTEEGYSERDEEFHAMLIRVRCPHCARTNAPLVSGRTALVEAGWRWVGVSHTEPYSEYLCVCPGCREDYALTLYTPQ